ncbi:hypothetical protein BpHYR1_018132 [Brachionus plicatilis]|uniref:Uncharacterized protein n=1 Tax=Brachionus plicatilis TaxID=10195 RepID=A0A3M7RKJ2_BRAPC|nr:hypothetical protein BpHYR1_018132 [Brachionus plicatilis]
METQPSFDVSLDDFPTFIGAGSHSELSKKLFRFVGTLCKLVKDQNVKIEQLELKLAGLEAGRKESSYETDLVLSNVVKGKKQSEHTQVLIASVNKELSEKARIENNVIVSGVGAGGGDEHDMNKVNEVLQVLNLDRDRDVKSQRRIRTSRKRRDGSGIDMIVVEFKCEAGKQAALRGARRLKDSSLRNVYIYPDKTPSERILDANLRNERDKRNNDLD